MKLAAFLSLSGITRSQFAERIGVTGATITGYCSGSIWPKREVMERIVAETNGAVTADDFLQMDDSSASLD